MLANERTLLSYWRTGLGLIAGGGTLLKLFPEDRERYIETVRGVGYRFRKEA